MSYSDGDDMTAIYEMFGLHTYQEIDIACPSCQGHAKFSPAKFMHIKEKKDIIHFQNSPYFEYTKTKDNYYGITQHIAIYYPNLHGISKLNNDDFPKGYQDSDFYTNNYQNIGVCVCQNCGKRQKHKLNFQKDAYYQTIIKEKQLWAFNKQHLVDIKHFIQSDNRREKDYANWIYLYHLPTVFKQHKNRDEVVKKIDKLLIGKF